MTTDKIHNKDIDASSEEHNKKVNPKKAEDRLHEVHQESGSSLEPQWIVDLDTYPERDKKSDPGWAIGTVKIWVGFTLFSLGFILWLLIMGLIHT